MLNFFALVAEKIVSCLWVFRVRLALEKVLVLEVDPLTHMRNELVRAMVYLKFVYLCRN